MRVSSKDRIDAIVEILLRSGWWLTEDRTWFRSGTRCAKFNTRNALVFEIAVFEDGSEYRRCMKRFSIHEREAILAACGVQQESKE